MNKTKKWFAVLLAVVMIVTNVSSLFAAETNFPLREDVHDQLVADENTLFILRLSQDSATKLITAKIILQNNGMEEIVSNGAGFLIEFTDAVVPVHKDTKVPFNGAELLQFNDVLPYYEMNSTYFMHSSEILSLNRVSEMPGRFIGAKVGAPGVDLTILPGEEDELARVYFKPTDISNTDVDLSMFSLSSMIGRSGNNYLINHTNFIEVGPFFMIADEQWIFLPWADLSDDYEYVVSPDSFIVEME